MTVAGKRIRVYADASVYGGAFDEEFDAASREFFDAVRAGRFRLEQFHFRCSVLRALPKLTAGMFSRGKPLYGDASVAIVPVLTCQVYPDIARPIVKPL